MKFIGLTMLTAGSVSWIKHYINMQQENIRFLKEWSRIFTLWKDWLARLSLSLDELIEQTAIHPMSSDLIESKNMNGKNMSMLIADIEKSNVSDKATVADVLKSLGVGLAETEIHELQRGIDLIDKLVMEREKTVSECKKLLIKLVPLAFCTLAVIVW